MTTLFTSQDLSNVQSSAADTVQSLSNTVLEAGYKITLLNLEMTRSAISQGAASTVASLGEELRNASLQPMAREVATYFKNLAHITAETQVEIARQAQSHFSEIGKTTVAMLDRATRSDANLATAVAAATLKSAVAAITASCHNLTETARRVGEMAEVNAHALADTVQSMSDSVVPTAGGKYKKAA